MAKNQSAPPKACAQCGTTRTPQWREGPEGPKTLCNACGVKRVRSMRTSQDAVSVKRKNPVSVSRQQSPALGSKRQIAAPHHSILTQAVTDLYPAATDASPTKRMKRAAALKATFRAHKFASTGTWSDDDVPCTIPISSTSSDPESAEHLSVQHSKDGHQSDSADEEVWGPRPNPADDILPSGVTAGPPTALTKQVGESSTAAIGLLAMSIPEAEVQKTSRFAPLTAHNLSATHPASLDGPVLSMHQASALCPIKASFERMCWAKRALPRDKSPQFKRLLQKAAKAYCSAIEAEGPVLETARLLAAKQAALSKSLAGALQANNELEEYIHRHEQSAEPQPVAGRGVSRRISLA